MTVNGTTVSLKSELYLAKIPALTYDLPNLK